MTTAPPATEIQTWLIDKFIPYARNPRKNDAVVDRMCGSIREFGFKVPILARSDGEVVDGHLRLKAAKKLRMTELPLGSAFVSARQHHMATAGWWKCD